MPTYSVMAAYLQSRSVCCWQMLHFSLLQRRLLKFQVSRVLPAGNFRSSCVGNMVDVILVVDRRITFRMLLFWN